MWLGDTKFFPFYLLWDPSKEISKRPINTLPHATPTSVGLWLGYTSSTANLATCLTVLAHSYRERISSLWLCRPVHFKIHSLAPSKQKGQGRNCLGPQLCAETVWMKSIAWSTSSERASCQLWLLQMTKERTDHNVYCKCSGCLFAPPRHEIVRRWKQRARSPSPQKLYINWCFSYHVTYAVRNCMHSCKNKKWSWK